MLFHGGEKKEVKANGKKMRKYIGIYKVEKRGYEEDVQRYQEDKNNKVEIINLKKRFIKTFVKAGEKEIVKKGAKAPKN